MENPTNFIMTLCVQRETEVEAVAAAAEIAYLADEWVQVDFRDNGRGVKVGPKGEVLLRK